MTMTADVARVDRPCGDTLHAHPLDGPAPRIRKRLVEPASLTKLKSLRKTERKDSKKKVDSRADYGWRPRGERARSMSRSPSPA
jgi:hypothetical protein